MAELKRVDYRGGLVRFQIPTAWHEEYEPDGGGTFYENGSSATLRLNVLTIEAKQDLSPDAAIKAVTRSSNDGRQLRRLPNGNVVAQYVLEATEHGQALNIYYWELAGPLPPRHMRIAVFSYTVLASESDAPAIRSNLDLLDRCVAEADFADTLAATAEGPKKPWWKFW